MRLGSSSDSAGEGILDELEAIDLGLVEIVYRRHTHLGFTTVFQSAYTGRRVRRNWCSGG
jgi:hypothetical protein